MLRINSSEDSSEGLFLNGFNLFEHNVSIFNRGKRIKGVTLLNSAFKVVNFFDFQHIEETIKEMKDKYFFVITVYPTKEYLEIFINTIKDSLPEEIPLVGIVGGSNRIKNYLLISERPFSFFVIQPVIPLYKPGKRAAKDIEQMKIKGVPVFIEKATTKDGFLILEENFDESIFENDNYVYISGRYSFKCMVEKYLKRISRGLLFIDHQYENFVWDKKDVIVVSVPSMFLVNVNGVTGISAGITLGMEF